MHMKFILHNKNKACYSTHTQHTDIQLHAQNIAILFNANLACALSSVKILNMKLPSWPGLKVVGTITYLPLGKE